MFGMFGFIYSGLANEKRFEKIYGRYTNLFGFNNDLNHRMESYLNKYNGKTFHQYKANVISLKSKKLLWYINRKMSIDKKLEFYNVYNEILVKVSKKLYDKFSPNVIYSFNDEIHLVFYFNDNSNETIYNGNINKKISEAASYASLYMAKEMSNELKKNMIKEITKDIDIDIDFVYNARYAEFNEDYEVLNYLIWRQYDCKRNVMIGLYRCLYEDKKYNISKIKLSVMQRHLYWFINNNELLNKLLAGNILKKTLVYNTSKVPIIQINKPDTSDNNCNELVSRKQIDVEHFYLLDNFDENFEKYIKNKIK